jgi:hypothetical protein
MAGRIRGIVTVKNGQPTYVKNISELSGAIVGNEDLASTLRKLFDAGWCLEGDYELQVIKDGAE